MLKQNKQIGIRLSKEKLKQYNDACSKLNSIMSLRIRKFIDLELEAIKDGRDLLKEIESHGK